MSTAQPPDLTARARLRIAAQKLFAERGFAATSTRAIAEEAGVSHALLRHHFGSKKGLEQAVDDEVLSSLGARLDEAGRQVDPDRMLASMGDITAQVFGADTQARAYVRRRLLEGGEAGSAMFARLLMGTRAQLERLGYQHKDADDTLDWAAYQVIFLVLGPLLLENVMRDSLGADPFDETLLRDRSRANQQLIASGLGVKGRAGH
ncbi:TetR/AcrR family transcriptional regulator [Actinopolymorpha alba]|uniref:TetR/AcrR family transcriptional regulator n=1 Tax=Actinopolymorpha alba TaxID=533267 RepID=UPI000371412D|nr:TetR/AcrR family transcriptional regulator [Actinopolymorpha alba]